MKSTLWIGVVSKDSFHAAYRQGAGSARQVWTGRNAGLCALAAQGFVVLESTGPYWQPFAATACALNSQNDKASCQYFIALVLACWSTAEPSLPRPWRRKSKPTTT